MPKLNKLMNTQSSKRIYKLPSGPLSKSNNLLPY